MSDKVNLDRSFKLDIDYPIGVKETVKFISNDVVTLTDVYKIVIAYKNGPVFKEITEADASFTKVDNTLLWELNFEHDAIQLSTYEYELQNLTQDYIEFRGKLTVTKTIA